MTESDYAQDPNPTADGGRIVSTSINQRNLFKVHTLCFKPGNWFDLSHSFWSPADLRNASLSLYYRTKASAPLNLRLAILTLKEGFGAEAYEPHDIAGVAHLAVEVRPGYSAVEIAMNQLKPLYGSPQIDLVDVIVFGGESDFDAEVHCIGMLKTSSGIYEVFGKALTLVEAVGVPMTGLSAHA